jgi:molecular chaperone IbpA
MRTVYDFSPLFRSSIGFDRVFDLLENATRVQSIDNWPPYNIEKWGDDQYRITMAVAGFAPADINIEVKGNSLNVSGKKTDKTEGGKTEYLHQGIASRGFERRFQLADHVVVRGADMENGLLHVSLKREVPEAMKPRTIQVNGASEQKVIENTKKAA